MFLTPKLRKMRTYSSGYLRSSSEAAVFMINVSSCRLPFCAFFESFNCSGLSAQSKQRSPSLPHTILAYCGQAALYGTGVSSRTTHQDTVRPPGIAITYLPLSNHRMTSNKPAASNKPPGQTNHPRLPEYPTTTQGEDSSNKLSSNASLDSHRNNSPNIWRW
jgi:hypothetical protein